MRAIWKGAITFGLVNVPVKIYSATESHDIALHQVHDADGGRIRYQRRCEICSKIVPYEHIEKAYDDGEKTVVLTAEDIKSLPAERDREIDVVQFVPSDQIDPIMFDSAYVLEPDGSSAKAYVLLRRTLEETDRTAIVEFALRQKTRLAALRVRGKLLMLQTLLWSDEVREVSFPALDEDIRIAKRELDMSSKLVESYSEDFDPTAFRDEYQEEMRILIEAKLEQGDALDTAATFGEVPEAEEQAEGDGNVIDLMEALKRSVDSKRAKASGATSDESTTKKTPAKKSPAKKAPANKAPAKKASGE